MNPRNKTEIPQHHRDLAAGDSVILNVQAARIEELEAQRDELLEALEKVVSLIDAGEGTWTLEEQQKARAAIAKAKGEE